MQHIEEYMYYLFVVEFCTKPSGHCNFYRKVFEDSYYFLVLLGLLRLFMWSWFDFGIWYLSEKYPLFYIFQICLVEASPYIQFHKGGHQNKPGSNKVCPCSQIKTQCHCPWILSLPSLPAKSRVYSLIICSITHSPAGLGEFPLDQSHHHSAWMHLS